MTGLLVSVRSAVEAEVALAGGADVVDIKEPRRGALGPADPSVWREIQAVTGERAITSAALGELLSDPVETLAAQATGFRFAKFGLAGCDREPAWMDRWQRAVKTLPVDVDPIPVAYADWLSARAPAPAMAIHLAASTPSRLVLIDTFDKWNGGLLEHLSFDALQLIAGTATRNHVRLALAGSLDESVIERVLELRPAYIGVRGAACRGGRDGAIDLGRVKSLARLVHRVPQKITF